MHRRTLLATPVLAAATAPPARIRLTFATHAFTATLNATPQARDLLALLPLALAIDDYSTNEKITYLPRKLTEAAAAPVANEAPGDIGYFAPWGNLALYHGPYVWSAGLFRLGRIDGGIEPLLTRGKFPLRIEALA